MEDTDMVDSSPGANRDHRIEQLTTAECWALLERTRMGRLALLDASGAPELFPVNYTSHEGFLYIRTANDSKLRHIRVNPGVAFEVDGNEDDIHWSVVVRGAAAQVTTDDEIRRSGVAQLTTASITIKPFYIRVSPSVLTGRRFRERGAADRQEPTAPPADRGVPRSTRPNPIPHLPPFEE
ncbi:pyridoxamine 5'-phosphate oxidase family protein [Microbacterium lushaniae]|nr:pyridoxamine 5'-phosphate oxidase family protein [Microbacterium lushaniae]KAA9153367.1 pyridoxamine 5'-phosphate oxidase family protein [Microbacterium lushaniae]